MRRALAIAACLLAAPSLGRAQAVTRVEPSSGLGAEMITALHQDRAGFLWVGSRQGLYVFDSAGFRRFEHDPDDARSLADNAIRTIFEDRSGNLWIGTNTGGLDRLDRATWTFHHHRHDSRDSGSLSHDSVNALAQEADGTLWVATQRGLDRLDAASGRFTRVLPDPVRTAGAAGESLYVYALLAAPDGGLWAGTVGGGVFRRDAPSAGWTRFAPAGMPEAGGPLAFAFAFLADEAGGLWAGTQDGLCRLPARAGPSRCFVPPPVGDESDDSTRATVTSLAPGPSGSLWVGTLGGLYAFDPASGSFRAATEIDAAPRRDTRSRVTCLLADRAGALWIGTWQDGLLRRRPHEVPFRPIDHTPRRAAGESDVTALFEDRSGGLWLATSGGGLYVREPGAERFR
nr:hypothetical protein [Acidobacteriota bacterium]